MCCLCCDIYKQLDILVFQDQGYLPASANEANSFIFCGMYLFRSSRYIYFFHNFRGLKSIPLQKRMTPNSKTTTLAHSRLSLLLNNNNTQLEALLVNMSKVALMFHGKFHGIKIINVRKKNVVQMRPLSAEIKNNN